MTKKRDENDEDVTGAAALGKIARRLSELFNVLSDFDSLPRRGRHEKDGRVMEYSFGSRALDEAMGERQTKDDASERSESPPRRTAKRSALEVLEPVTDIFDEQNEVVLLFELPGVEQSAIRCILDGDILLLEAKAGERLYRKETLIEGRLAPGAPRLGFHNGVLEVRLHKET